MEPNHIAQSNNSSAQGSDEVVIDLGQVINFFVINWKKLLIGAALGLLMACSYWAFFAPFKAELMLLNKTSVNSNSIDFIAWQQLVKKLPSLATKLGDKNEIHGEIGKLSSSKWWSEKVTPIYALSKSDIKDLSINPKNIEDGNLILGLSITDTGPTALSVRANLLTAGQFIRTGGSFLAIESLLGGYESRLNQGLAQINSQAINLQIEMQNLHRQSASLEDLRKQFPQMVSQSVQINGLKNSDVKYLPLTTQLIAVNLELASAKENIEVLRHQQDELEILGQFLGKAKELIKNRFDGLALVKELISVEMDLERGIDKPNLYQRRMLEQIKLDLVFIDSRYGMGLEVYQQGAATRGGMWKYIFGGLVSGAILAALVLLMQIYWRRYLTSHQVAS